MTKAMFKMLWMTIWQFAMFFTIRTVTKVDDNLVNVLMTDEAFEDLWQYFAGKGWVSGNSLFANQMRRSFKLPAYKKVK